jgi:hypothetical protein
MAALEDWMSRQSWFVVAASMSPAPGLDLLRAELKDRAVDDSDRALHMQATATSEPTRMCAIA